MIGRVRHSAARESAEARIPLAPYTREGSVSGAKKGPRLPALESLEPSGSVGSSLNKATLLRLPESVNLHTHKQTKALIQSACQVLFYWMWFACRVFLYWAKRGARASLCMSYDGIQRFGCRAAFLLSQAPSGNRTYRVGRLGILSSGPLAVWKLC